MSDQGLWWKLWCAALDDPSLDQLDVADFGRFCKLGAYIKRHGTLGQIKIDSPSRVLCAMFQVPDFKALLSAVSRMPNVVMRRADNETVNETDGIVSCTITFNNWSKFQGDLSTYRVRNFRAKHDSMKRSKRRREEKRIRREETPLQKAPKTSLSAKPKTAPPAKPAASEPKPYLKPDPDKEPERALICAYKVIKGVAWDDRRWDKVHYARAMKSAKDLIAVCGGLIQAHTCMKQLRTRFNEAGLSWTFETIVKHAHEWAQGGTDGRTNRQSFSSPDARIQAARRTESGGGFTTGGEVLAGIRGLSVVTPDSKASNGRPNRVNGHDVDEV